VQYTGIDPEHFVPPLLHIEMGMMNKLDISLNSGLMMMLIFFHPMKRRLKTVL
jgi:hypothetical protein